MPTPYSRKGFDCLHKVPTSAYALPTHVGTCRQCVGTHVGTQNPMIPTCRHVGTQKRASTKNQPFPGREKIMTTTTKNTIKREDRGPT